MSWSVSRSRGVWPPPAYSGGVPDPQRSREWRPWALLVGTLVVGLLLAVSKVRPLVLVGVVLVLSCVFILVRMVADRRRTRR